MVLLPHTYSLGPAPNGVARLARLDVLDDRATPDRVLRADLPEPDDHEYEPLSRLATALARRWLKSLGRVVEVHGLGGFHDQIQLQSIGDRVDDAAKIVGAIAGPGSSEGTAEPVFDEMASAFMDAAADPVWSWRGAWGARP